MEDTAFWTLWAIQIVALLIYRWVGKVFFSQPRFNHPAIFWNPTSRFILCYAPMVVMAILVALAFFITQSPWWFLGFSFIGFVMCSTKPSPELLR